MDRGRETLQWRLAIVRWTARLWGLAVSLAALAFFIEHLGWYGGAPFPPLSVTIATAFHLVTIIGLVAGWRWEVEGACTALVGAAGFVLAAGGGWRFVPILGVVAVPAILWLSLAWLLRGRHDGVRVVS
jgi:hypothetical protein